MGAPSKQALRHRCREQRLQQLPEAHAGLQATALRELPRLLGPEQWLGIYWPLRGEADLRLLAEQPGTGSRLALPRVAHGRLSYRAWQPDRALSPDDTGIPAPTQGPELEPAQLGLILAPALACDQQGIRLGYGGGWFDRLRGDPVWAGVPALTVLPAGCVLDALPRDPWDVPFHGRLDEHGVHWLQPVSARGR